MFAIEEFNKYSLKEISTSEYEQLINNKYNHRLRIEETMEIIHRKYVLYNNKYFTYQDNKISQLAENITNKKFHTLNNVYKELYDEYNKYISNQFMHYQFATKKTIIEEIVIPKYYKLLYEQPPIYDKLLYKQDVSNLM